MAFVPVVLSLIGPLGPPAVDGDDEDDTSSVAASDDSKGLVDEGTRASDDAVKALDKFHTPMGAGEPRTWQEPKVPPVSALH